MFQNPIQNLTQTLFCCICAFVQVGKIKILDIFMICKLLALFVRGGGVRGEFCGEISHNHGEVAKDSKMHIPDKRSEVLATKSRTFQIK